MINEHRKIFTGLDIGTTTIKAVVGTPTNEGLKILARTEICSEGVTRTNITNVDKVVHNIQEAIQTLTQLSGSKITCANISISGHQTTCSTSHNTITKDTPGSEITHTDLRRLKNEIKNLGVYTEKQIIDIIPKEYTIDLEEGIKEPIGMHGTHLAGTFHVITSQASILHNLYKCAERAGVNIDNLVLSPIASSISILTEEEKQAGVCLVDIGASTTGLTIYHRGSLQYTNLIPFGGEAITKDLAQAFMLMESQAEQLKKAFGSAYENILQNETVTIPGLRNRPEKEIFLPVINRVIEVRMEEIIQIIYKEILCSGFQNKLPGGIVLTGGGAKLKNIYKLFTYITNYDTRVGYPHEFLQKEEGETLPDSSFATAIGLALAYYKSLGTPPKYYPQQQASPDKQATKKQKKKGIWSFFKKQF